MKYKVKQGRTFGSGKLGPGSIVELTDQEAEGLDHILEPLPETEFRPSPESVKEAEAPFPIVVEFGEGLTSLYVDDPEGSTGTAYEPLNDDKREDDGPLWPSEFSDDLIDRLEDEDLLPEDLVNMADDQILAIDRIGPATLRRIRESFPRG